ncbi:MAG: response regulator [Candidatus Eisenbacteria bacterium]|nr:response regulator [Candidatus Eisenbacteria bacterium]
MVRGLVRETLELAGYEVLEARHGKEALTVCEQHPGPIHLMVTDVVMPEMGGPELVKHLPTRRRGMKVLFLSGHAQAAFDHPDLTSTKAAFLQKPFALDAFTRKVRDVLDEAA